MAQRSKGLGRASASVIKDKDTDILKSSVETLLSHDSLDRSGLLVIKGEGESNNGGGGESNKADGSMLIRRSFEASESLRKESDLARNYLQTYANR